jgi:hypothetical protein
MKDDDPTVSGKRNILFPVMAMIISLAFISSFSTCFRAGTGFSGRYAIFR